MSKVKMTKGKFTRIQNCSDSNGIIAAAAMDQRGSLKKSIEKARGTAVADDVLTEFKTIVTKVLTPYSSAILMDPEYGLPSLEARAPGTGVLLAYEKTGYDVGVKGRLPDLLPEWSARRLLESGADAVKILLYYNPFDDKAINSVKTAFIERIGAECAAVDVPFFLEPLAYDDNYDEKGLEFAKIKPKYVTAYMEEFSKDRYGVDILKVEIPFNVEFLAGSRAFKGGEAAYDKQAALGFFHSSAAVAKRPFIYLSAGVDDDVFRESLELAAEAGVGYSGVLCGRATWKEGVPVFGEKGGAALEEWLLDRGVKNIQALNEVLAKGGKPWYSAYGGLDNIEVVG
ncbi:MAG: tagatose 1,6-diphosphate aldolase [Chloroflexi bacterium]|uniref:tagatose-bisphosphate aldolase n=1 Tax=Candidatus Chlorohelix allophototropha TaxID=3003348 RepID=A0A8T7LYT2_9CHLR|nr:tagatose 1,6-diphosphate aldolase [Chloroflexota bacterium]WJW65580.1 tagatose 1,6-diphosphate aldolase [Chloroflexota bacterium L227-S17]